MANLENIVSKKLGVAATAIGVLAWLSQNPSDYTAVISWQITTLTVVYMVIQGIQDFFKTKEKITRRNP